ncbi:MAG: hypothetical protein L0216_02820 [Planctomycetales bacterium]|nr:hypothetical protein [Planctomycetales bacterium]
MLLALQDAGSVPVPGNVGFGTLFWLVIGLLALAGVAAAFWFGRTWGRRESRKAQAQEREKMFAIEKALKDFFDNDRMRIEKEKAALEEKSKLLERKSEEYRQKAAGVGVMGLGKDRKAELLLALMVENEALEEKLYEQNLRLKEERDEHLKRELGHISVKRVLLSEVLKEGRVQETIREVLADDSRLKHVSLDRLPAPAGDALSDAEEAPRRAAPPAGDGQTDPARR